MTFAAFQSLPTGVEEATQYVEGLDDCLFGGFARLGPKHNEALDALAATFSDSPLGGTLPESIAAIIGRAHIERYNEQVG